MEEGLGSKEEGETTVRMEIWEKNKFLEKKVKVCKQIKDSCVTLEKKSGLGWIKRIIVDCSWGKNKFTDKYFLKIICAKKTNHRWITA